MEKKDRWKTYNLVQHKKSLQRSKINGGRLNDENGNKNNVKGTRKKKNLKRKKMNGNLIKNGERIIELKRELAIGEILKRKALPKSSAFKALYDTM
mmetsp:Transcript_20201/g.24263  ORF Transcript_20201/g.24263 Transcript_20201/m.24263 type:complete len:96 (-) Transcript_20201:1333-1620(-)